MYSWRVYPLRNHSPNIELMCLKFVAKTFQLMRTHTVLCVMEEYRIKLIRQTFPQEKTNKKLPSDF